jgi:hypothetical protein
MMVEPSYHLFIEAAQSISGYPELYIVTNPYPFYHYFSGTVSVNLSGQEI